MDKIASSSILHNPELNESMGYNFLVGDEMLSDRQLSQPAVPQAVVFDSGKLRTAERRELVDGFRLDLPHFTAPCAFTFDDGPYDGISQPLLEWLITEQISATFFLIGSRAKRMKAFVRELDKAGMIIGSHGFGPDSDPFEIGETHESYGDLTPDQIKDDITKGHDTLCDILGKSARLFRPPFYCVPGRPGCPADEPARAAAFWNTLEELKYTLVCGFDGAVEDFAAPAKTADELWRNLCCAVEKRNPRAKPENAHFTQGRWFLLHDWKPADLKSISTQSYWNRMATVLGFIRDSARHAGINQGLIAGEKDAYGEC